MLNIINDNAKIYKLEALYDSARSFYGRLMSWKRLVP